MPVEPAVVFAQLSSERLRRITSGLQVLVEAYEDAASSGRDVWQFAVRLGEMHATGLTSTDVRWLISRGLVRHALERTEAVAEQRSFASSENLSLPVETSLVLQALMIPMLRSWLTTVHTPAPVGSAPRPRWYQDLRELRVKDTLVKRYRVPARSQEIILASFEEDNWPDRIDDPLPVTSEVDPAQRLHDAVRGLNRNQRRPLIRFERDGRGKGVCWYPRD